MDLSEFLMVEHSEIRVIVNTGFLNKVDNFKTFTEFLLADHINIEENIYFPIMVDNDWNDKEEFKKIVERVKNDHKLIETLAKNIMKWKDKGNENLFNLRLPLFYKTLEDHNNYEEDHIFSRWLLLEQGIRQNAMADALSIVQELDDKYLIFSGLSINFKQYMRKHYF